MNIDEQAAADAINPTALTKQQIEAWRNVLTQMFGPYALIMPEREIYKFRDRLEREAAGRRQREKR